MKEEPEIFKKLSEDAKAELERIKLEYEEACKTKPELTQVKPNTGLER